MKTFLIALLVSAHALAEVESETTAAQFRTILENTTGWSRGDQRWNELHLIPKRGGLFDQSLNVGTLDEALRLNTKISLKDLAHESTGVTLPEAVVEGDSILTETPVTVVIIPGVFGEMIPIDPFDEFFGPQTKSKFRDAFVAKVAADRLHLPTYLLRDGKIERSFDELVHVGSIRSNDGSRELAPVIVFRTPEMSLESVGKIENRAVIFTRRLNEYLRLMGQKQKLLFVGYSRGTVIGLEMLARAEQSRAEWLPNVVGIVSLGGVVWGSSIADATDTNYVENELKTRSDISADTKKAVQNTHDFFQRVKEHRQRMVADGMSFAPNLMERMDFVRDVSWSSLSGRRLQRARPQMKEMKGSPVTLSVDASGARDLANKIWDQFSWNVFSHYADDLRKYHIALDAVTDAVEGLQSSARKKWFSENVLPKNVTYYSVVAAMANPDANELEKSWFLGSVGYANQWGGRVRLNFDDIYLLQGRLDYESQTAIALNDSQVSAIQASFIPGAMEEFNPQNRGLKTKFLGVMGTHHWGLALKVVNQMRKPRINPFPRSALLKALAVQAAKDARP